MTAVTGAIAGLAFAFVMLVPLSIKWQLPQRTVWTWSVLLGAASGVVWAVSLGPEGPLWLWALAVCLTVLGVSAVSAAAMFFRDPDRQPPSDPDAVLSPADGTVVYVRAFSEGAAPPIEKHGRALVMGELAGIDIGGDGHIIGIGMHLLNVHVNRAPIAGRVVTLLHVPGRFESLKREGATCVNERLTTVIEGGRGRVVVVQIASRLVRRIVSYLADGQDVARGQRIGVIKFGSQVDVIIPDTDSMDILVSPGDAVEAGVSVIAGYARSISVKE